MYNIFQTGQHYARAVLYGHVHTANYVGIHGNIKQLGMCFVSNFWLIRGHLNASTNLILGSVLITVYYTLYVPLG